PSMSKERSQQQAQTLKPRTIAGASLSFVSPVAWNSQNPVLIARRQGGRSAERAIDSGGRQCMRDATQGAFDSRGIWQWTKVFWCTGTVPLVQLGAADGRAVIAGRSSASALTTHHRFSSQFGSKLPLAIR